MNTNPAVSHFDSLKQVGYYFSYYVNGVEKTIPMEHANVVDVQINWDSTDTCVEGYCLFNDAYRLTEILPPMSNIFFKIKAYDFSWNGSDLNGNAVYEEEFVITRMERQFSNTKNLTVKIDFIDKLYFGMANTFIGRGYNNKKSTEVIKDMVSSYFSDATKRKLNFYESEVTHDNLAIPQNKPFIAFIKAKELRDGFSFVQSRYSAYTISHNHIENYLPDLYQGGKGVKFIYDEYDTEMTPFKIKTIKFLSADNLMFNALLPDTIAYEFDQGNMSKPKTALLDVGAVSKTVGDTSVLSKLNSTKGFRRLEVTNQDSISRFYKFKLLETTLIEITVSGMFFYELLWKVGLDLKSTIQGYKGKMPYVNGNYHILKIVDKFNGTNFNQVITLGRVGIENVSKS